MSDHYRTLGLQPNASKSDIRNAYFRLAHRYHPDHHDQADVAGRAAAAALFRKAKDAYEVLYEDGRRAEYDRFIRRSSPASSGNRHGPYYGGGASPSSTDWDSDSGYSDCTDWGSDSGYSAYTDWECSSYMDWGESDLETSSSTDSESDAELEFKSFQEQQAWARGHASSSYMNPESELESFLEKLARAQGYVGGANSSPGAYWNMHMHRQCSSGRSGYEHGGGSSTRARGHRRASRRRPPQRPRPMASGALFLVCCAVVLGGSALLLSLFKRENKSEEN